MSVRRACFSGMRQLDGISALKRILLSAAGVRVSFREAPFRAAGFVGIAPTPVLPAPVPPRPGPPVLALQAQADGTGQAQVSLAKCSMSVRIQGMHARHLKSSDDQPHAGRR
jgi:hypothetical protein